MKVTNFSQALFCVVLLNTPNRHILQEKLKCKAWTVCLALLFYLNKMPEMLLFSHFYSQKEKFYQGKASIFSFLSKQKPSRMCKTDNMLDSKQLFD